MNSLENIKKYFLINISLISIVGIIMVYSASYIYAKETFGSSTHFFFKQILFLILGAGAGVVISKTKIAFWYKNIYAINIAAIVLLFLTMTPLGLSIKGSQRWLSIFGLNIQPGEFIKYTVCFSSIYFFNNLPKYDLKNALIYSLNLVLPLILLIIQPDFGTFTITAILISLACFLSDFPRKWFYAFMTTGALGTIAIMFSASYRVKRLLVFLDPWKDPQNSGFQIIQSYLAFANGHIFGQGIGNSNEKLFYLPEAYNDFIFSVIGEELGLVGVLFVVFLFMSFTFLGFKLALTTKSKINAQLIFCLVFCISLQAFLNMGVVLGLLPTKGLNLPLISYGGSSLIANLIAIGTIFGALATKSQIGEEEEYQGFTQTRLG